MEEPKKKKRRLKGKIRLSTLFFLAVTLASNTFAWFIYNTRITSSIETSVRQWKLSFDVNGADTSTNINLDVENIYPGMQTNTQNVRITNSGQMSASIIYEILECKIVGEDLLSLGLTNQEVLNKLKTDYPFIIDFNINTGFVNPDDDESISLTVKWDYESGNDALDTYWGNESYYYHERTGLPSIVIKIRITATQVDDSSGFPSILQKVEYLQSDGYQYIDTGYKPFTQNITADVLFKTNSSGSNVFGIENTTGFRLFLESYGENQYQAKYYVGSSNMSSMFYDDFVDRRITMSTYGSRFDATIYNSPNRTITEDYLSTIPTNYSIYLFSANNNDSSHSNFKGRIYSFKLYDNDVMVRDMVPCYMTGSGEIGMYDMVGGKFYSNKGSSVFIKGPDIIDS